MPPEVWAGPSADHRLVPQLHLHTRELYSTEAVKVASSLAWFKPDEPNPALGARGSARRHLLESQCMATHPAAKWAVSVASALAFLWKTQGGKMSRSCSPICYQRPWHTANLSSFFIYLFFYLKSKTIVLYSMYTLLLLSAIVSCFPFAPHSDNYFLFDSVSPTLF